MSSKQAVQLDCGDWGFGPVSCERTFDFTLLFEWSILSILPAASFLLLAAVRLLKLHRATLKAAPGTLLPLKTLTATTHAALLLALLVASRSGYASSAVSTASAAVSLVSGVAICWLTVMEHLRSLRPSTLIIAFLLLATLFDAAIVRTLFMTPTDPSIRGLSCATLAAKVAMVAAEAQSKRRCLLDAYSHYPDEVTCSIISWTMLWWLRGLFFTGFRRLITPDDLHLLDDALASKTMGPRAVLIWGQRKRPEGKFALIVASVRCIKLELLAVVPPRLLLVGFSYAQTFLIQIAVSFVSLSAPPTSNSTAYGLIGAAALIYIGIAVSTMHYQQRFSRARIMFRGAVVSLIFGKTLELQDDAQDPSAALTLMSTDIDSIIELTEDVNEIWARSIEVIVGIYLLERQLGAVCVVPIIVAAACCTIQMWVAKHIPGKLQTWNAAIQDRVSLTSQVLNSMKNIKMMGLATMTSEKVQAHRVRELGYAKSFMWFIIILNTAAQIPIIWSPVLTFAVYILKSQIQGTPSLTIVQLFTSLAIISLVTTPASKLLATIPETAAAIGAFSRIQTYLVSESIDDQRNSMSGTVSSASVSSKEDPEKHNALSMPEKAINPSDDRSVIDVKSATVRPDLKADAAVKNVSFALHRSQILMVTGPTGCGKTTLAKALLGDLPCDPGLIAVASKEIAYCSQTPWLSNASIRQNICGLPTVAGLLDEDHAWYNRVLYVCALDEDLDSLPQGDTAPVGSKGVTLSGGQRQRIALARAIYSRPSIAIIDDMFSALDAHTRELIADRLLGRQGLFKELGTAVVWITHEVRFLHLADRVLVLDAEGQMLTFGAPSENESISQLAKSGVLQDNHSDATSPEKKDAPAVPSPGVDDEMDRTRRLGDIEVYKYYIKSFGWPLSATFISTCVLAAFFVAITQVWLARWSEAGGGDFSLYLPIYILLGVASGAAMTGTLWATFVKIMPKSASRLHQILLNGVMDAPYSFFTSTDTGVTINRFSQDMSLIDLPLPIGLYTTGQQLFNCIATTGLIFLGSSYIGAVLPLLLLVIYLLQDVYLKTSRQLRYLDLEAKSPLYSHFLEMVDGLATIRAFGWGAAAGTITAARLDRSQQPMYQLFCIQRWLNLVLDLLVAGLAVLVVALAGALRSSTNGVLLGLALNNILLFGDYLSQLITAWTMLETSLGAIARVRTFEKDTATEHLPHECAASPPQWPSAGAVSFSGFSAGYSDAAYAIEGITAAVKPGEKVGICGRTGSGKSTLLLSLLRLLDAEAGSAAVDGIELSTLPKNAVRQALVAVPQDPYVLPGTVRLNCDPAGLAGDGEITEVLADLGVWKVLEERGGLDADLKAQGLSHGQLQLLCLARAVLRKEKVVLLDESTSGLDPDTDRRVQDVLRRRLQGRTVLAVAHRLETIVDYDRILVMDKGRVVEYDTPAALLARDSQFKAMYDSMKAGDSEE